MAKRNLVVAERNPELASRLAEAIEGVAYGVGDARGYYDFLMALNKKGPDMAIIGEDLPIVNGWDVCAAITGLFHIPVIIVGNSEHPDIWERVLDRGADYYLRLPFSPVELRARVEAILRRYDDRKTSGSLSEQAVSQYEHDRRIHITP